MVRTKLNIVSPAIFAGFSSFLQDACPTTFVFCVLM